MKIAYLLAAAFFAFLALMKILMDRPGELSLLIALIFMILLYLEDIAQQLRKPK